jgi:tetratricopeptide (TPR) repeat protein
MRMPTDPKEMVVLPPYYHLLTIISTVGVYLRFLVLPVGLCVQPSFSVPDSPLHPQLLSALPWELAFGAGIAFAFRRSKMWLFALVWILIALVPASNLRPLGRSIAEGRAYAASVGYCMVLALVLCSIPALAAAPSRRHSLRRLSLGLCGFLVILGSGLTVARNVDWGDNVRLLRNTIARNPRSVPAHNDLAIIYTRQGRTDLAFEHLRRALALAPGHADALCNMAELYRKTARPGNAIPYYEQVLQERPDAVPARVGLGLAYAHKGWRGRAVAELEAAVQLAPESADAHSSLGLVLLDVGRHDRAMAALRRAVQLAPESAAAHRSLGTGHGRMGRHEDALREYNEALRLQPASSETWLAMGEWHENRGELGDALRCYRTCRDLGGIAAEAARGHLSRLNPGT